METKSPRFSREGRAPTQSFARRLGVALALIALPSAAFAGAVTVKGKATGTNKLVNPVWDESKNPKLHRFTFREPSPTVRADFRNSLTGNMHKELCIAALGAEKAPTPKVPLRMKVVGGRTDPVTLVVTEGQQIQFENLDPFPH